MNLIRIENINGPEMDIFARATEPQLREEGMFLEKAPM